MRRYPRLGIRSKNELAKRISDKQLPYPVALKLINDATKNFNQYWYDSKQSDSAEGKYVRSAVGNSLGRLLGLIDRKVLAPHDRLVPEFVFGGISGKNHIQAAYYLLGERRGRTLLGLDIRRFFEQVGEQRVFHFFHSKCGCSVKAAKLLAGLCCVPKGSKSAPQKEKSLARGFATSARLALWCNLDLFQMVVWATKKHLRGRDPRVAIFVDDIGITASRVSREQMEVLFSAIEEILTKSDPNQVLPLNMNKKKILSSTDGMEHLGLRLGRNKLTIGSKTMSKIRTIRRKLKKDSPDIENMALRKKLSAYKTYRQQITKAKP